MLLPRFDRLRLGAGALLAVIGVTVLASSLSTIELTDGPTVQLADLESRLGAAAALRVDSPSELLKWLSGVLRIAFFVLLPPSLLYLLVSAEARRRVVIQVLSLLLISQLVLSFARSLRAPLAGDPVAAATPGNGAGPEQAIVNRGAPRTFVTALSAGLAVAVVVGVSWAAWRRRRSVTASRRELQAALASMNQEPASLESVMFQVYRTLCRVSEERKGIRRRLSMTPREYRLALERAPLPREHLLTLTTLFEQVRYGGQGLSPNEEEAARGSLGAILREIEHS